MLEIQAKLLDLRIAFKTKIGPHQVATGIVKKPIDTPVYLTKLGIAGDFQVDRRVHGGFEKAICHFPYENYKLLKEAFVHLKDKKDFYVGENFKTQGLTDTNIHIGDIFKIGEAIIQVSQPRMPCWKLNHKLGNAYFGQFIILKGITGWYYRVLEEGTIQKGNMLVLKDRVEKSVSVSTVWKYFLNKSSTKDIPGLSSEWNEAIY